MDNHFLTSMIAGLTFAEQMARLTSDIVWLVERSVTLSNGRRERVLVPRCTVTVFS